MEGEIVKVIKRNKFLITVLLLFICISIFAVFSLKELLYPNEKTELYGNRLMEIEKFPVSDDTKRAIADYMKDSEKIVTGNMNINGKIIRIHFDVVNETNLDSAKTMANEILIKFPDTIKEFYDIEFYVTEKGNVNSELFPIIGSKSSLKKVITWINKGGINE